MRVPHVRSGVDTGYSYQHISRQIRFLLQYLTKDSLDILVYLVQTRRHIPALLPKSRIIPYELSLLCRFLECRLL